MSARDGLGLLPFADYADPDPGRLPLDDGPTWTDAVAWECRACGADQGEECRPSCIGEAAHLEDQS